MRCAIIQMTSQKDVDVNLKEAEKLIAQAAKGHAKLVVLPEMFACLGVTDQYQLATSRFTPQDVLSVLSAWGKHYNLYIIAGSLPTPASESEHKVHATCIVFSPQGKQLASYNKIHLFDVEVADEKGSYKESNTFLAGTEPKVVRVEGNKLGLSICYDLRFPELYQEYMSQGCTIMTIPSAFTYQTGKAHWEVLLRARAIETQSYILAANQVGIHEDGRRTWGHSMIVSPEGVVLAELDGEEPGVVMADLDFKLLQQCRQRMPILQHKRLKV